MGKGLHEQVTSNPLAAAVEGFLQQLTILSIKLQLHGAPHEFTERTREMADTIRESPYGEEWLKQYHQD